MLPKQKTNNVVDFPKDNRDQIELIKKTVARGATDDELALFLYRAKQLDLDPLSNQIYFVKRKVRNQRGGYDEVATIQVGIEGLRLIAERSGRYEGQEPIKYIVQRGEQIIETEWVLPTDKPVAAKAAVYKKGCVKPFTAVAHYNDYVIKNADGTPNSMWRRWTIMLAKCAESLALRKAFPELNFSGVYEPSEASHIETPTTEVESFETAIIETEPVDVEHDAISTASVNAEHTEENFASVIESPEIENLSTAEADKEKEVSLQKKTEVKQEPKSFTKTPVKDNAPDVSEVFGDKKEDVNLATSAQINAIMNLVKIHGIDEKFAKEKIKGLTYQAAAELIKKLGRKDLSFFGEPF